MPLCHAWQLRDSRAGSQRQMCFCRPALGLALQFLGTGCCWSLDKSHGTASVESVFSFSGFPQLVLRKGRKRTPKLECLRMSGVPWWGPILPSAPLEHSEAGRCNAVGFSPLQTLRNKPLYAIWKWINAANRKRRNNWVTHQKVLLFFLFERQIQMAVEL